MSAAKHFALLVWLAAAGTLVVSAQVASPAPAARPAREMPPPLPVQSPIDFFRFLLAAPSAEREKALAARPPNQRKQIELKLKEYTLLPLDERELRLQMTEMRYYMKPLMEASPASRGNLFLAVPEDKRKLIESRLQAWDRLPRDIQKSLLSQEDTIHYLVRLETSTEAQRRVILERFPAERRAKLENEIAAWKRLPEDQRRKMYTQFLQFFELTPREKTKILSTLSDTERQQMEAALNQFSQLGRAERRLVLDSFGKLADFSTEQRNRFLRQADLWQVLPPSDRKLFRDLVTKLPPMPPGLNESGPVPMPPLPDPKLLAPTQTARPAAPEDPTVPGK